MTSAASNSTTIQGVSASSTLSALTPSFTMVPSSVRRRASAPFNDSIATGTSVQDASDQRKRRPRPRQRKKKNPAPAVSEPMEMEYATPAAEEKTPVIKPKRMKKPTKKNTAFSTAQEMADASAEEEDPECCLLCADLIKFNVVGECNHHGICSKCSMRMRLIMDDRSCPMCKQPLDRVVVSSSIRPYESFELWGNAAGPESVLDEKSEMIFVDCRAHYYDLRSLREFKCRMKRCREMKHSLGQLKEHMRHDHGVEFCELCLTHQSFFIQEQEVFTKGALKGHNIGRSRGGSAGQKHANTGKDFHPMCQFCQKRFYGDKELYEHLERDHFKCHICKVENEYFRNYASLETHFRREHHLCEDPKCLEMRFVVFLNDVEYHAHMSSIHGVRNRLQFNFQVARGGGNSVSGPVRSGYADGVPDHWNYGVSDHPPSPSVRLEEAFPALPTPAGPAPPPVLRPAITRASNAQTQGPPVSARRTPTPPRGQICRNQRLAQALGVSRPGLASEDAAAFEEEIETPKYPEELIVWGKVNTSYLTVVERRLERIVQEPSCHSVSLRVMSGEERALMHQLASFYGVVSESFGEDPRRRVSFFKREDAHVPSMTLSAYISNLNKQVKAAQALSRLKYLPLRSSIPPPQATPVPAGPVPVNRGWEHIEPRRTPVIADAWSDDDDESGTEEEGSANSSESQEQSEIKGEKPLVKQIAVADVAENSDDLESSAEIETLKAKVAAVKIDEEEWE